MESDKQRPAPWRKLTLEDKRAYWVQTIMTDPDGLLTSIYSDTKEDWYDIMMYNHSIMVEISYPEDGFK